MGKITIRGLNSLSQNLTVLPAPSKITPSVIACGDATFPKGTAFVVAIKFSAVP